MSIDKLFKAFSEYLNLKKSHDSGEHYSFPLIQVKREAEAAIIELVDTRIKAYLGRKKRSGEFEMPKYLEALNSAPMPPVRPAQWLTGGDPIGWIESYTAWYYGKRKSAIDDE